jgi:hypothetical protein
MFFFLQSSKGPHKEQKAAVGKIGEFERQSAEREICRQDVFPEPIRDEMP